MFLLLSLSGGEGTLQRRNWPLGRSAKCHSLDDISFREMRPNKLLKLRNPLFFYFHFKPLSLSLSLSLSSSSSVLLVGSFSHQRGFLSGRFIEDGRTPTNTWALFSSLFFFLPHTHKPTAACQHTHTGCVLHCVCCAALFLYISSSSTVFHSFFYSFREEE